MRDGKLGKSLRTAGHSDQYLGCTSTTSSPVVEASIGGKLDEVESTLSLA